MNTSNQSAGPHGPPSPDLSSSILSQILACIGILGVVLNVFILCALSRSAGLRKSSPSLTGLTLTHVINSTTTAIGGFWSAFSEFRLVSPLYCIEVIWPNLFIVSFQLLPLYLLLAGLERLLALAAPVWFRTKCTVSRLWRLTACCFGLGLISMGVNWALAWKGAASDSMVPVDCLPPMVVGPRGAIYAVHVPAVIGGLAATVLSASGIYVGRRRVLRMPANSIAEVGRLNRHIRLAKCLLMISAMDSLCVVIPNFILILYNIGAIEFPLKYVAILIMVYSSDASLNILAFLLFNSEFRKAARRFLGRCGQNVVGSNSVPIGSHSERHR